MSQDPIDDYYNGFYRELAAIDEQGNSFAKIADLLPELAPRSRVLDVGCGHGSVSHELVKRGHEVTGLEANEEALESLRRKGFIAIKGDFGQRLSLPPGFDLILLLDVLEHVFNPLLVLEEARRLVATGGKVLVSVPLYFDLLDRLRILVTGSIVSYDNRCYGELAGRFRSYNYDHLRFFRPKEVLELCALSGLRVERVVYSPMWMEGLPGKLLRIAANRQTARLFPGLLAHGMRLRLSP